MKVVAIVDLFGGPDPKILKWFRDDGTGVKESKDAPTPELDASLKAYLHGLQTRADQFERRRRGAVGQTGESHV